MKVGDLVVLSSAGQKVQGNHHWHKITGGYGLVTRITFDSYRGGREVFQVRIFGKDGKYWSIQHFYRYELKKFKAV